MVEGVEIFPFNDNDVIPSDGEFATWMSSDWGFFIMDLSCCQAIQCNIYYFIVYNLLFITSVGVLCIARACVDSLTFRFDELELSRVNSTQLNSNNQRITAIKNKNIDKRASPEFQNTAFTLASHHHLITSGLAHMEFIWQDREILFDAKSTQLECRRGEKIIDSINSVEDTKGGCFIRCFLHSRLCMYIRK